MFCTLCNNWNRYRSGQRKSIRITAKINPFPFVAKSLVLAAVSVAFGCTSLGFGVRDRAESAFRRQNQLSAEFMLAAAEIESRVPAMYESLLVKEELMLDACLPLNTLASKHRDDEPVDFGDKKAIPSSLEACEQATSDFDKALRRAQRRAQRQTTEL